MHALDRKRVCWAAVLVPVPVLAAVWMPMGVAMWLVATALAGSIRGSRRAVERKRW